MARTNTSPAPFRRCSGTTNKSASHGDTSWLGSISDSARRHVPIGSPSALATSATPWLWSEANSSSDLSSSWKDAWCTGKALARHCAQIANSDVPGSTMNVWNAGHRDPYAATRSSFPSPRITILSTRPSHERTTAHGPSPTGSPVHEPLQFETAGRGH